MLLNVVLPSSAMASPPAPARALAEFVQNGHVVDASKCCFAQHGFQRRSDRVRKYGCAPAPATNNATPAAFAPPLQHQGIASQDAPCRLPKAVRRKGEIFDNMLLCIRAETGLITQLQHGRLVRLSAHKTQFR
jgi:hypothetical protein